ncbi:MAG: hypothetical protein ACRCYY_15630 [Trueperaceae bacterium]
MKYFVEVIPESIGSLETASSRLATVLKLDATKTMTLLKRNPVTKPVSQEEAEKVARLFSKAGLQVTIRPETGTAPNANVPRSSANITSTSIPTSPLPSTPASYPVLPHTAHHPIQDIELESYPTEASVVPELEQISLVNSQGAIPGQGVLAETFSRAPYERVPQPQPEPPFSQTPSLSSGTAERDNSSPRKFGQIPAGFFPPVSENYKPPEPPQEELLDEDLLGEESHEEVAQENAYTPVQSTERENVPSSKMDSLSQPTNGGNLFVASVVPGLLGLLGVFGTLYATGSSALQLTTILGGVLPFLFGVLIVRFGGRK